MSKVKCATIVGICSVCFLMNATFVEANRGRRPRPIEKPSTKRPEDIQSRQESLRRSFSDDIPVRSSRRHQNAEQTNRPWSFLTRFFTRPSNNHINGNSNARTSDIHLISRESYQYHHQRIESRLLEAERIVSERPEDAHQFIEDTRRILNQLSIEEMQARSRVFDESRQLQYNSGYNFKEALNMALIRSGYRNFCR